MLLEGRTLQCMGEKLPQDEAQMADDVKRQMEASQQLGYGILSAMLTTEQKLAAKVLEGLGWTMAIESAKKHSETNLQLWCWAAKDVDKADVVVTNPFAKPKPAVVEMPEGSPVNAAGERMKLSSCSYGIDGSCRSSSPWWSVFVVVVCQSVLAMRRMNGNSEI